MTQPLPSGQNRARGLYDEQLQRQQQEKALIKGGLPGVGKALFQLTAPDLSPDLSKVAEQAT